MTDGNIHCEHKKPLRNCLYDVVILQESSHKSLLMNNVMFNIVRPFGMFKLADG